MKTTPAIVLLSVCATLSSLGQRPVLQITGLDRAGALSWTNHLCTTQPVYEVLRAQSLTGPWEHVSFVTNQTSVLLSQPSEDAAGASFYRLACVEDVLLDFDYAFDEGYGFTSVTGRLSLALFSAPGAGSWACQETGLAIDGRHPTGAGLLLGGVGISAFGEERVRAYLKPGVEGAVFLEGALRRGEQGGRCTYTECVGTVYEVTFAGSDPIGTFVATRR